MYQLEELLSETLSLPRTFPYPVEFTPKGYFPDSPNILFRRRAEFLHGVAPEHAFDPRRTPLPDLPFGRWEHDPGRERAKNRGRALPLTPRERQAKAHGGNGGGGGAGGGEGGPAVAALASSSALGGLDGAPLAAPLQGHGLPYDFEDELIGDAVETQPTCVRTRDAIGLDGSWDVTSEEREGEGDGEAQGSRDEDAASSGSAPLSVPTSSASLLDRLAAVVRELAQADRKVRGADEGAGSQMDPRGSTSSPFSPSTPSSAPSLFARLLRLPPASLRSLGIDPDVLPPLPSSLSSEDLLEAEWRARMRLRHAAALRQSALGAEAEIAVGVSRRVAPLLAAAIDAEKGNGAAAARKRTRQAQEAPEDGNELAGDANNSSSSPSSSRGPSLSEASRRTRGDASAPHDDADDLPPPPCSFSAAHASTFHASVPAAAAALRAAAALPSTASAAERDRVARDLALGGQEPSAADKAPAEAPHALSPSEANDADLRAFRFREAARAARETARRAGAAARAWGAADGEEDDGWVPDPSDGVEIPEPRPESSREAKSRMGGSAEAEAREPGAASETSKEGGTPRVEAPDASPDAAAGAAAGASGHEADTLEAPSSSPSSPSPPSVPAAPSSSVPLASELRSQASLLRASLASEGWLEPLSRVGVDRLAAMTRRLDLLPEPPEPEPCRMRRYLKYEIPDWVPDLLEELPELAHPDLDSEVPLVPLAAWAGIDGADVTAPGGKRPPLWHASGKRKEATARCWLRVHTERSGSDEGNGNEKNAAPLASSTSSSSPSSTSPSSSSPSPPPFAPFTVNGRPAVSYFPSYLHREHLLLPLALTGTFNHLSVTLLVRGGGLSAQAQAARLAIAKALASTHPALRRVLKDARLLRRDPRVVERKKYGQKKARKKFTWVRR